MILSRFSPLVLLSHFSPLVLLSHFFAINLLFRFSPLVLLSLSFFRHQFTLPFCSIGFFLSSTVTLPSLSSFLFFYH
ncbi:hypothetical protein K450DRAFT_263874 [Umbelopsis ramanniana AG]|uniref:Uncharacterized protein n=1 Tax=Umbelopsis ramanniana AG TaxID=1314678 RepID=A0AAD5DYC0_UMBRA|nr:uncharacterized protein K450DRAFT_263874 [Umbelopsis ramanniana AG]KAI8574978.1 hypothetical protein K450DRAFT_263874 [Umbelopsis ramanniana AG]